MRLKALAFAAAFAAGAALAPQLATAAVFSGSAGKAVQSQATESTITEQVQRRRHWRHRHWRHRHLHRPRVHSRCARVRRECAFRFGWGGSRYVRCVIRRGC